jgi:serine/threonine protein kinase/SH3-like domain-containing protein
MASVFVSYRRKPSAILAQLIAKDLKAQGIEVYLDIERMEGAGVFPTRLFQAIDASDVFVCLLGDDTLESEWVQNEIQRAHEMGKPMIPVFQETYEIIPLDQVSTPYIKTLLEYDGVYIFDVKNVYVPQAVEALARMIENTAAWAKQTPPKDEPTQIPILSVNIEALTGQQFGQYHITELLGIGGMSAVYKAHQESLMRDVALKVLPPSFASQANTLERFLREARTAAALEHAHIVPVYDYGNYGGLSFVVMRILNGGSLAERLTYTAENNLPLPALHEVAEVLKRLANALDYAHSRGVIHRDIKANNVMFDEQGSPYLVDFGIAKLTHAANSLTGTGVAMGTPLYMSPEQWRGESVTPAADQYAMGVTTYAMVTGHLPFEAPTPYALMHKHLNEQPPPPKNWRADLPDSVRNVIEQAMAKKPNNRFPSAKDFALAFEEAVRESGIEDQATEFFTLSLPNKTKTSESPLVGGTPVPPAPTPNAKPPTPPPLIEQGGVFSLSEIASGTPHTNGMPAHHPASVLERAPTPLMEAMPLTNPSATQPTGTHTPRPTAVPPVQTVTPPPGYVHQITPSGQSIFVQQATPMEQAHMFVPPKPAQNNLLRWLVPALVVGAALVVIGLVASQNRQAIETIQQTQDAVNATSLAVGIQMTVDSEAQTVAAAIVTATLGATTPPPATATATPATPVVQAISEVSARLGPSTDYPIITTLEADGKLDVVGISEDGGWYQVILPDGTRGWIVTSGSLVNIFGDIEGLEVASMPTNTPTATVNVSPTRTPSPTLTKTPAPTSTVKPSSTPSMTPTPGLQTDGKAQISAGEFGLAVRSEASRNSGLVVNLPDETLVDIIDGPQTVEGSRWWKISAPEGQTGWVEEKTDGKANLIPHE